MTVFKEYSNYYDYLYEDKDYKRETQFIEEIVKLHSKKKVKEILSLGCGTCSHEIVLAKHGYSITGVDISSEMLKTAKKKIKKEGLENKIKLYNKDVRKLNITKKHDIALAMFNVVGYMTRNRDVINMFERTSESLKPESLLLFDCWHLPAVLMDKPESRVKLVNTKEGEVVRSTDAELDIVNNILTIQFQINEFSEKKQINQLEETHKMRIFTIPEIKLLLDISGFDFISAYDFLDAGSDVDGTNWNIFVIAVKK